jgi:hypothetical protein
LASADEITWRKISQQQQPHRYPHRRGKPQTSHRTEYIIHPQTDHLILIISEVQFLFDIARIYEFVHSKYLCRQFSTLISQQCSWIQKKKGKMAAQGTDRSNKVTRRISGE